MRIRFGLIGTITYDHITFDSSPAIEGLGGVLYQAAVLCGLGQEVYLYTNLGEELVDEAAAAISNWDTLRREGIHVVAGQGNRVHLHYPEKGERVEVLKSVVPPLDSHLLLQSPPEMDMLILVINSGFDIELSDWRKVVHAASCPVWIDFHSLALKRKLHVPRDYVPLLEWREWAEGASFIQANRKEVAAMLGCPDKDPSRPDLSRFGKQAFELGLEAVFVTLGQEGVLVMSPGESRRLFPPRAETVADTTGCGDVFCSAAALKLAAGEEPFAAARFGLELATRAVAVRGIAETHGLALRFRPTSSQK